MRVLMPNTFHYQRGGDSTYTFSLTGLLEANGHEVIPFAMHHPKNIHSEYAGYFTSHIDYVEALKNTTVTTALRVATRSIYSAEARRKADALLQDVRPDIVHMQNIHNHLTPSILYSFKKAGIPVVWTLHDFKLICPNTSFLSHGEVCEKCKARKYFLAPLTKCKKNSTMASLMAGIEGYVHWLLRTNHLVDRFITPSGFLKEKLIEYGFDRGRIVHIPNFVPAAGRVESHQTEDYFVYVGRLMADKGVDALIKAVSTMSGARLVIAGDGPVRVDLEKLAKNRNGSEIEFLGYQQTDELRSTVEKAKFTVVSSRCYENCPYSILESFALGKPVVAANIGGIPELVDDGINGLLFEPDDVGGLKEKIEYLLANPARVSEMGAKALEKANSIYSADFHYAKLMQVYKEVLSS